MADTVASVRGLTKSFGRLPALTSVSFDIRPGEVIGLIGPNGAGKTTLMECMAGLLPLDAGEVVMNGHRRTSASRGGIYFVPDGITPWETRPVLWTLRFFEALHRAEPGARQLVIDQLNLPAILDQPIGELSRGQRKRVLLALGLLTAAPLLLVDEPFEGLDLRQVRHTAVVLRNHAGAGRTLLLSMHQLVDAARVCDRMVLLTAGTVVGTGTLDDLRRTAGLTDAGLEEVFLALT